MILRRVMAMNKSAAVIFGFALSVAVILAGCVIKPTGEVSDITGGSDSASVSEGVSSLVSSESEVGTGFDLKLMSAGGKIMLWPSDFQDYLAGSSNGGSAFYVLDEMLFEWVPAEISVEKVANVEAKTFRDTEMMKFDVFRISVGEWSDYYLRNGELTASDPTNKVLEGIYDGSNVKAMHTKDHAVLQICDDLYTIDEDGDGGTEIRRVSARSVAGFDYETADKKGVPDVFAWEWISQPVCSPENNIVLYLTAREEEYYSIWSLDLDANVEKNAGMGTAIRLGEGSLLISDNGKWSVDKEDGKVVFSSGARTFEIDADEAFSVHVGSDKAFLTAGSASGDECPFKIVDLTDGSAKDSWYLQNMKIDDWEDLMGRIE